MKDHSIDFEQLPLFFEGNSRILKESLDPEILICKLKPTVFSIKENGPVFVEGIDKPRTAINALLCELLHNNGIKTSTLRTVEDLIFTQKQTVPPIEVVVKGSLVGSPKHIYKGIGQIPTRSNAYLSDLHAPYVRFDWRNPLPFEDHCMPTALAHHFIDTEQASKTALTAYKVLQKFFQDHNLNLLDICFFMNTSGTVICAEISTDNTRIVYTGENPDIAAVVNSKEKEHAVKRAETILQLIKTKDIA